MYIFKNPKPSNLCLSWFKGEGTDDLFFLVLELISLGQVISYSSCLLLTVNSVDADIHKTGRKGVSHVADLLF